MTMQPFNDQTLLVKALKAISLEKNKSSHSILGRGSIQDCLSLPLARLPIILARMTTKTIVSSNLLIIFLQM